MNIVFKDKNISDLVKGLCLLRGHYRWASNTPVPQIISDLSKYGINGTRKCAEEITNVVLLLPLNFKVEYRTITKDNGVFNNELRFGHNQKASILCSYLLLYDVHYRFMYQAIFDLDGRYIEVNRDGNSYRMFGNGYFQSRYPRTYKKIDGDFMKLFEKQRKLID